MSPWRARLAALRLGLYFVLLCLCLLHLGLRERWLRENSPISISRLAPAPAQSPVDAPAVGVTIELAQYSDQAQQQALARLQKGGLTWVRQRFDWATIEPEAGHFEWQAADTMLANIAQSGLDPVVVLDGSPAWARDPRDNAPQNNPWAPPADPATFARFAQSFAARYGPQVRTYQIWHEPNIAPHWGNRHIEPIEYARLLSAAGRAIRAVDPDARIITAALAPTADRGHTAIDEIYFLQRLYAASRQFEDSPEAGLLTPARLFDVVAVEPLGFDYAPTDSRQRLAVLNFQRVKLVRRAMVAAGDAQTPLWAVRFGWNTVPDSPWGQVSPAEQVRFAALAVAQAQREWPWLTALGWAVDQPNAPPTDPLWGFALNEQLLHALGQPAVSTPLADVHTASATAPPSSGVKIQSAFLLLLLPLIAWRSYAAGATVAQQGWLRRIRHAPGSWPYIGAWVLLLIFYYVAVWPPLLALCWLGFVGLAWLSPLYALCATAALLPFHFQHKELALVDWHWQLPPAHMLLLALLPALGRTLLAAARTHRGSAAAYMTARWQSWDGLALAWLAINLASSVNVWHWPAYGAGLTNLAIMPLLLYAGARLWATDAKARQRVAIWLFCGGLLAALWGWSSWLQGDGTLADGVRRLVGPHFSPNHTALYLERTLFLGVGLALSTSGIGRWVGTAACVLVAGALMLTFSRGALLLGIPAGVAVFYLYRIFKPHKLRPRHWAGILAGCALLLLFFWLSAARLTNSASVTQRVAAWWAAGQLWLDYPLLGVGANGFFWRYPAYTLDTPTLDPNLRHPHNLWLEFATSWGIIGIGWLGAMLWLLWRRVRLQMGAQGANGQALDWVRMGLLAGLAAGLMHGQADAFMVLADLAGWNWLALGLLAVRKCT